MMDNSNIASIGRGLFRRDGHLSDLSLDRFEAGELPMSLHEHVVDHLDHCRACSDRWQELSAEELRLEAPGGPETASSSRIAAGFLSIVATVVAAAALLLILWPPQAQQASRAPASEGWMASSYTSTSSEFDLATVTGGSDISVFAEGESVEVHEAVERLEAEPLGDGARVPADAPLRVHLAAREPHYAAVMLASAADASEADDGTGGVAETEDLQILMAATKLASGSTRDVAVPADAGLRNGDYGERIIVLMCSERFSIVAGDDLDQKSSTPGCRSFELGLHRFAEIADS